MGCEHGKGYVRIQLKWTMNWTVSVEGPSDVSRSPYTLTRVILSCYLQIA
jgi:hypothetical protein